MKILSKVMVEPDSRTYCFMSDRKPNYYFIFNFHGGKWQICDIYTKKKVFFIISESIKHIQWKARRNMFDRTVITTKLNIDSLFTLKFVENIKYTLYKTLIYFYIQNIK